MLWRCTCNYSLSFHCLVEFDFAFACIDFKIGECVSKIHHFVSKSRPSRHLLFSASKSKDVPDQSRKYNFLGGLRRSDWPRRIVLYCPVLAGLPERKLVTKIWSAMQHCSAQACRHATSPPGHLRLLDSVFTVLNSNHGDQGGNPNKERVLTIDSCISKF